MNEKTNVASNKRIKREFCSLDEQEYYFNLLPKKLRNFLMYDSPSWFNTKQIFDFYINFELDEIRVLKLLKENIKIGTRSFYSKNHPEA